MRCFEELRIWQESRLIVKEIYQLTTCLKDYGFRDQLQRATISIINNIAEGSESGTDKMFVRYLNISQGSCSEVKSMLYVCEDLKYCDSQVAYDLRMKVRNISAGIQKLLDYLKQSIISSQKLQK
ncbi:MAG: four helix bundle protein [Paludibacter sp.]|nr:four helix bundle protein [Paludibacter sp.]